MSKLKMPTCSEDGRVTQPFTWLRLGKSGGPFGMAVAIKHDQGQACLFELFRAPNMMASRLPMQRSQERQHEGECAAAKACDDEEGDHSES